MKKIILFISYERTYSYLFKNLLNQLNEINPDFQFEIKEVIPGINSLSKEFKTICPDIVICSGVIFEGNFEGIKEIIKTQPYVWFAVESSIQSSLSIAKRSGVKYLFSDPEKINYEETIDLVKKYINTSKEEIELGAGFNEKEEVSDCFSHIPDEPLSELLKSEIFGPHNYLENKSKAEIQKIAEPLIKYIESGKEIPILNSNISFRNPGLKMCNHIKKLTKKGKYYIIDWLYRHSKEDRAKLLTPE